MSEQPTRTIMPDGTKEWWLNGKLHRTDGPAIERPIGTKMWHLNGQIHRTDGPAVEYADGGKEWWVNGELHREDGPAIIWEDGAKMWWLNGERLNMNHPYVQALKRNRLYAKWKRGELTDEEKVLIRTSI